MSKQMTERDWKTAAGRERKKRYDQDKKALNVREEENYSKLILLRTSDDWGWVMFGHSALIFTYDIAPKLNLHPNFREDTDNEKNKDGCVSIKDVEALKEQLAELKILPDRKNNRAVVFLLRKVYTEEEIKNMRRSEIEKWRRANKLVAVPPRTYPSLASNIRELETMVFNNFKNAKGSTLVLVGNDMLRTSQEMLTDFMLSLKLKRDQIECFERIMERAYYLEALLVTVGEQKLFSIQKFEKMAFKIQDIEKNLMEAIKKEKQAKKS